jgi:hypothetical protein
MKKYLLVLTLFLLTVNLIAQSPQVFNFQAVIRNSENEVVKNQTVGIQISILQGQEMDSVVYIEKHAPFANANGLVTLEIGNGDVIYSKFDTIDWSQGPYFIKTETDPMGGENYTIVTISQLLSVPYALFASQFDMNEKPYRVMKSTDSGKSLTNSLIYDDGYNIGIGDTMPSYRLSVVHGGSTGICVKSTNSFSVVDIDGYSGDAAIRFKNNGVNQWNIRNNPATDDLQIFELGGGGERMRIENSTGKVVVDGDFTAVGTKAFTIDHPLDPVNKQLKHAAIESNEVLNCYSGNIVTDAKGKAIVKLPDYYEAINKDPRYQLTVVGTFAQAIISQEIKNNQFEISTSIPNVKVSWEVKSIRNDAYMQSHPFQSEVAKTDEQKSSYIENNKSQDLKMVTEQSHFLQSTSSIDDSPISTANSNLK